MNTCTKLPESHKNNEIARIETERSKVLSPIIKGAGALIALILFGVGCLFYPLNALLTIEDTFEHLVVLMLGLMAVMLMHELLKGLAMRIISGVKPVIKYISGYPHVGCEAFFPKKEENIINITPFFVGTLMLAVVLTVVPDDGWRWMVWIMMILQISNCVGDFYAILRMSKMPDDILVQNVGATYRVFSAKKD